MACANDDLYLFAFFHPFAESQVGIPRFDCMGQGTDRMGESVLGSQTGCTGKVKQRSRRNDQVIIVQADLLACPNLLTQHILVAGIRMNFFCRGVDEL